MPPNTNSIVHILPATTDDLIFGYLTPASLIAYSRACKYVHAAVVSFYRRAFQIENTLGKYFATNEVIRFRELQEITGTIISGSTALEFFDRTEFVNSILDLYVDHRFRRPIAIWLQSIGYKLLPCPASGFNTLTTALNVEPDPYESYPRGILVIDFKKSNYHPSIRLTTTRTSPLELVLRFDSTCVMNLITHDKAYSIFPQATFEDRRSLVFVNEGDSAIKAREKYEERGWTFVEGYEVQPLDRRSPFAKGVRRLGDSKCWSISLHHENDGTACTSHWDSNSWRLTFAKNRPPMNVWVLLHNPSIFHFSYLVNHRLAYRVRKGVMGIGYDEETGEYTDFYAAVMTMLSSS